MRALAIAGSIAAVFLLILGSYLTAIHHRGGVLVLVIGAVGLLFWLVMVPVGRRLKKI